MKNKLNILISLLFVFMVAGVAKAETALTQDQLLAQLINGDRQARRAAAIELSKSKYRDNREIIPALILTLENDTNTVVRDYAAEALANNSNEIAFTNLIDIAKRNSASQAEAINALIKHPRVDETLPIFINSIGNENRRVRIAAAKGLAEHGQNQSAFDAMKEHLNSNDESIAQDYIAEGIRRSQNPEAMNVLISSLKNRSSGGREAAADELGSYETQEAYLALFQATYDNNDRVVAYAIRGLEEQANTNEDIINRMIEIYENNDDYLVGDYALEALLKSKNIKVKRIAEDALKNKSAYTQELALETLLEIGDTSSLLNIIDLLGSDRRSIREEAHEAFRTILRRNISEDEYNAIVKCLPQATQKPYSEGTQTAAVLIDIFTLFLAGATIEASNGTITDFQPLHQEGRDALKKMIESMISDQELEEINSRRISSVE